MAHYVIRIARHAGIVLLFVAAAVLGVISGMLFAYSDDLPRISALDDYAPSTITRVHASDGRVIGEFAVQRRVVIGYDDIAPRLRQAIISAEDGGFDRHFGLSVSRIAVTAVRDVLQAVRDAVKGERSRPAGASTLTQQLARNLFPEDIGFQVTPERKIKEAVVALQIEKRYTKREIFVLYCNHIHFGHGTYGVESASRLYFGKSARELSLEEAAMLAGIIQSPARQSPFVDKTRTMQRRNYVLQRMAEEGYLRPEEAAAAKQRPIVVREQPAQTASIAPYFVEEIRKHLERTYGAKRLYESGLTVHTTLDVDLQEAANAAVDRGLRALDKRRGFRPPSRNVLAEGHGIEDFTHPRWARPIAVDAIVPAVVVSVSRSGSAGRRQAPAGGSARLRIGSYEADLTREGIAWTRRGSPAEILKAGDVIEVKITGLDEATGTATVTLEQQPLVEGALVAIDNRTGQIRAMVGGLSFARSKFNRATQAYRQMGSGFKPFVYATAIDRGYTPTTILSDTPASFNAGAGQPPYMPQNYDRTFEGPITLRRAIERSRNVPAVRMMEQLGPKQVLDYARRFGLQGPLQPFLSLALGAGEASLLELTSAYSAFPNRGVRMTPYQVTQVLDRDGNLLEEGRPEPHDTIRADTAFILTNLLRGVVLRGTGTAAAALEWPLGGKSGTTDDCSDAWFTGFDPNISVGVWVGLDDKKPLGATETGSVAALPIWMDFYRAYIEKYGDRENPPAFEPPPNIVFMAVDRATGVPTAADTPGAITEAFISGTQPGGFGH